MKLDNTLLIKTLKKRINNKAKEKASNTYLDNLSLLSCEYDNTPICDRVSLNNRYAHLYWLKKYAGIDENVFINCTIEHGMDIVNEVPCEVEVSKHCKKIITFSQYRKKIIEKETDMEAIVVGPYIAYSKNLFSEKKIKQYKMKLGKVLLVIPSHSADIVKANYNIDLFIKEIKKYAVNYNNVIVCLYYKDINLKNVKKYKKEGFIVVSAGCSNNLYFLPRLKAIISISDAVLANNFTTGIAYALYLNKPIFMFKQNINLDGQNLHNEEMLEVNNKKMDELYQLCNKYDYSNIDSQRKWGEYMFGLDEIKSRQEMNTILKKLIRK